MNALTGIPTDYDDIASLKTPPHSLEAEQSVLGGLMIDPGSWDRLDGMLTAEDFYRPEHRLIFAAASAKAHDGQPIDPITLADALSHAGTLDQAGGIAYLAELAMKTPSAANIRAYATAVRDRARLRALILAGNEIADSAYNPDGRPVTELIDLAQASVMGIGEDSGGAEPVQINSVMKDVVTEIDRLHESGVTLTGISTGFRDLDSRLGGLQRGDLIIVAGRPSMGKAQPLTSGVLLANGLWKAMGYVEVGDSVASPDGNPSVVTGVFPQGVRPIYRVSLSDGRTVEADADHLWRIESCKWTTPRTVTTLELMDLLARTRYQRRIRLAEHSGEFGSGSIDGIDPWLLGFLLGDGCLAASGVQFSNPEPYIHGRVEACTGREIVAAAAVGCDYRILHSKGVPHPLRIALAEMGLAGKLAHEKFVPAVVLRADKATRRAVLAGLLESDGWVEKCNSVQFSSSSESLADGVVALVRSLGGAATKRIKAAPAYRDQGEIRRGRPAYIVTVALDSLAEFIRSPRLLKNLKPRRKPAAPVVIAVDFARHDEAQCIAVSHASHLYITDGYTVTHNTTLAMNIAERAALRGEPVQVFSMEMPRNQIMKKSLSSIGDIPFGRIRTGQLEDWEWPKLSAAVSKLKDKPLYIDDRNGLTVAQIRTAARKANKKTRLSLVVVDYLQLCEVTGKKNSGRTEDVTEISKGLKNLARELDAPVIVISQLNRNCENRPNKRPVNADLRDSGAIEQDADVILFVYRDEVYNADSKQKGVAEIICRKQRLGEIGSEYVAAKLNVSRFDDLEPGYRPPEDEKPTKKRGGFEY